MNNFNLSDAPESNVNNADKKTYQKPGIYENVVISGVSLGSSSLNKIPYLELQTVGPNGELGKSNRMWLSTTVGKNLDGSPKKTSGWGVTARNIVMILQATHNITREEATAIQLVPENETNTEKIHAILVNKLSTLLVGRPFRAKFKGEQSKPRPDGTPGLVFATLDLVESMSTPKDQSTLRFDPSRDIKLYEGYVEVTDNIESSAKKSDLPF